MLLRNIFSLSAIIFAFLPSPLFADELDEVFGQLSQDAGAEEQELMSRAMQLKPGVESRTFWKLYSDYSEEQGKLTEQRVAVVTDYINNSSKLTESKLSTLVKRAMSIDEKLLRLKQRYVNRVQEELGTAAAAKFYQAENRLSLKASVELAVNIPIVKDALKRSRNKQ